MINGFREFLTVVTTPQNCTVIVVDSSYIKDYPAPPAEGYNGKERSDIELNIDVMKAGTAYARL